LSERVRRHALIPFSPVPPPVLSTFSNQFEESELSFFSNNTEFLIHHIAHNHQFKPKSPSDMPRILEDLTRAICPSFEGEDWDFLRQPMIDAHVGDQPLSAEEATQRMREAWTRQNKCKVAAWNEQLEQDRAEQEEQDWLAQEEEEVLHAQREREAEELHREAEKRKPKLNTFDRTRPVSEWIEPRPAQYTINKVNNLEYIELDYFTTRGCREASTDTNHAVSHDTLTFTPA
jgi:hypothetical protein